VLSPLRWTTRTTSCRRAGERVKASMVASTSFVNNAAKSWSPMLRPAVSGEGRKPLEAVD